MPKRVTKSGRFLQRLPKSLHENLAKLAESEGVSLNTLITSILAAAVEARLKKKTPRKDSESLPET